MVMKEFILVISMWGSDGTTDHYIGQIALQHPFSEKQCHMLIEEDMWASSYDNEHYHMKGHCFPKECAGKDKCD